MSRANSNESFIPNCVIPEDEIEMESEGEYPDSQRRQYNDSNLSRYLYPNINFTSNVLSSPKNPLSQESPTNISKFLFENSEKLKQTNDEQNLTSSENLSIKLNDLPPIAPNSNSNLSISSKLRGRRALRNTSSLEFPAYSYKLTFNFGNLPSSYYNHGHPHFTAPATPTNWKEEENLLLVKNLLFYFLTATL